MPGEMQEDALVRFRRIARDMKKLLKSMSEVDAEILENTLSELVHLAVEDRDDLLLLIDSGYWIENMVYMRVDEEQNRVVIVSADGLVLTIDYNDRNITLESIHNPKGWRV